MVLTCSRPPKVFLTRWRSVGGKCKDGSPTASGPPLCRSLPQNPPFRHSQFSFRTRGGWLLFGSSPPRRRSTPPRPASAGPFPLYSRPGRPTLIAPCAHAWLLTSCHSTGKLRSAPPQCAPISRWMYWRILPFQGGPLFCPTDQLYSPP